MTPITFYIPCLFGLEALVGDELRRLHLKDIRVENGHVLCCGTVADVARLNLNLRCGERVLVVLGAFTASSFDALFEQTKALPWRTGFPGTARSRSRDTAWTARCTRCLTARRLSKKLWPPGWVQSTVPGSFQRRAQNTRSSSA